MKPITFNEPAVKPNAWKRFWITALIGVPAISGLLLATQPDVRSRLAFLIYPPAQLPDTPYRYPFSESLTAVGDPSTRLQREIAFYQQRVQQNPQGGLDRASLALTYLGMARLTGQGSWYLLAENAAKQSLANLPFDNPEAILVLARVAEARHDFPGALRLLQQVAGHRDALPIQVTANLAMGNTKVAGQAVNELVARSPSISSMTLLAMVQAAEGKDREAEESFRQALATEEPGELSNSARTRTLLGRFYYEQGKLHQAEALYQEALRIFPNFPLALINLAQLEVRQGQYRSAEEYYDQVVATANGETTVFDPLILRGRARINALQGDRARAEQRFAEAESLLRQSFIGSSTTSFGHRRDLARLLLEREQFLPSKPLSGQEVTEVVALLRQELRRRRDADTLEAFAWALSRAGQWQEAQKAIQEALSRGVRDAKIFYRAGEIEQALGHASQAQRYFLKAKTVDPGFAIEPISSTANRARQAAGLGAGLGS